jgi:hypothetical protein
MNKLIALALLAVGLAVAALNVRSAESTTETVSVQTIDRIWRIQIFADYETDPKVEILHERVRVIDGAVVGRTQLPTVSSNLSPILGQSVTLASGKTLTVAELHEAIILLDAALSAVPAPAPAE